MGIGAGLMAVLAGLVIWLSRGSARPPAAVDAVGAEASEAPFASGAGGGAPPDISNLTPRERFDRLYNRIMKSAESGDQTAVTQFTPMALMAYQQLDSVDADARFHAALLMLHTGDIAGAKALGDTVLLRQPGHLFGYIILGTAARWAKDDAELKRQYTGFLKHYDAEMKLDRAEYRDHGRSLDDFKKAAEGKSP